MQLCRYNAASVTIDGVSGIGRCGRARVSLSALRSLAGQERALAATHLRLLAASLRRYLEASALSRECLRAGKALRICTRGYRIYCAIASVTV
jgi:hypothetical protein